MICQIHLGIQTSFRLLFCVKFTQGLTMFVFFRIFFGLVAACSCRPTTRRPSSTCDLDRRPAADRGEVRPAGPDALRRHGTAAAELRRVTGPGAADCGGAL